MAISSLSKLGLPLSGNQSASNQGLLMPKLQYRFRVLFQNFGVSKPTTEMTKQVISTTRPSPEFEEITLDVYNSRIKLAGKPKWGDISIVVRDDISGAVSKLVGEQLQKQFDFFEQSSAASAGDYKFTMRIEILDGGNGNMVPSVLETWECYGCYVESTNWQDLKYSEQGPAMIDLSIRFDNAVQTAPVPAIGSPTPVMNNAKTGNNVLGA